MRLDTYKQFLRIVTVTMGLIIAVGVVLNNYVLPLAGLTACMLVIYVVRRRTTELDRDERTSMINQKSSQATLSVTIVSLSMAGLALIILSREGILPYEELGFQVAMLGLLVMALKAFFDWYYRSRYGG